MFVAMRHQGANSALSESELVNPLVPSHDELDRALTECEVVGPAPRDRWQGEVLRRQEEFDAAVGIHKVIQEPEIDVADECAKEVEEVAVATECISEWVRGVTLVGASVCTRRSGQSGRRCG